MLQKSFMTMALMLMAMAVFDFAEGGRIKASESIKAKASSDVGTTSENIKALHRIMLAHTNFQGQVKHAVEQVDTLLADPNVHDQLVALEKELEANPQLQQSLDAMLEDPILQKKMALVEEQIKTMKLGKESSSSLLEVSESSGGQATIEPWKVMAAAILCNQAAAVLAFRIGTISGSLQPGSALSSANIARPFPIMNVEDEDVADLDKAADKAKEKAIAEDKAKVNVQKALDEKDYIEKTLEKGKAKAKNKRIDKKREKGAKVKADAEAAPKADEEEGDPMGPPPEGFDWGYTY